MSSDMFYVLFRKKKQFYVFNCVGVLNGREVPFGPLAGAVRRGARKAYRHVCLKLPRPGVRGDRGKERLSVRNRATGLWSTQGWSSLVMRRFSHFHPAFEIYLVATAPLRSVFRGFSLTRNGTVLALDSFHSGS